MIILIGILGLLEFIAIRIYLLLSTKNFIILPIFCQQLTTRITSVLGLKIKGILATHLKQST